MIYSFEKRASAERWNLLVDTRKLRRTEANQGDETKGMDTEDEIRCSGIEGQTEHNDLKDFL